ncbi:MAG: sensor histidine kinase, partial [Gammaproteobacteria bacterium]
QHLPEGLYNAVREGLINSARHAGATNVRVTISIEESGLRIFVSDNGKGFHFQGSYDLAALRASGLGPKSLMDRIDALQGQLTIDSGASGAKLTMSVPLPDSQSPAALSSKANSGAQPGQNLHDH